MRTGILVIFLATALAGPTIARDGDEWAKGVTYTTKWDEAIKACQESGKLLFIYNGWQNEGT